MSTLGIEHGRALAPDVADPARPWQRGLQRWLGRLMRHKASAKDSVADDARAVRELARTVHGTDPAFAADLYAAADRHEQQLAAS
jgi:hypothetical protein